MSSPVRGIGLGLLQVLVLVTLMNQQYFEKNFIRQEEASQPRSFHSIFTSKKSVGILKTKLLKLPGILSVEEAKDSFNPDHLNYLADDLKEVMANEISNQEYYSLKVSLDDKVDERSEKLVKSFIAEFNKPAFLGSTETSNKVGNTIPFVEKYLFYEILLGLLSLWLLMVFICSDSWKNYLYVLNRSNRMTNPGPKIVFIGLIIIWLVGGFLGASLSTSELKNALFFLPFVIIGSLLFTKLSFNRGLR